MLKRLRTKAFSADPQEPIAFPAELEPRNEPDFPSRPDTGQTSTRDKLVGSLQIILVLLLMTVAIYYSRVPAAPSASSGLSLPPAADTATTPVVSVITPIAGVNQVTVSANGSIGVSAYVDLIPQVSGRVAQLAPSLEVGGTFRAGETLAVIEQDEFTLKLRQAAAEVEVQRANLQLQQAKSDAAVQNYSLINPDKRVPPLVALGPQIAQAQAQ